MAYKTAYDPLLRMALVPRVFGSTRFGCHAGYSCKSGAARRYGNLRCVGYYLPHEVGHVAIGNHWYQHLCRERGLEPVAPVPQPDCTLRYVYLRGYVNIEARERAGFSRFELDMLEDFEKSLKQDKKAV